VKRFSRFLPLFAVPLCLSSLAKAQSSWDVNLGFGSAHAGATGSGIENLNSSAALASCTPSAADPNCQATPSLGGFFMGIGSTLMLQKHYGVSGEISFQPGKSDYGPLRYRQIFYDVNGVYAPINEKKFILDLQGGIGGATSSFSVTQSQCAGTAVCSSSTQSVGSSKHFQLHAGVGLQYYVTEHVFIRPQFDIHYVPNLTQQFSSNAVVQGMVWVGYSFGDR